MIQLSTSIMGQLGEQIRLAQHLAHRKALWRVGFSYLPLIRSSCFAKTPSGHFVQPLAPRAFGHKTLKHLGWRGWGGASEPGTLLLPVLQPISGTIFISGQFRRADVCLAQRKIVSATSSNKNDFLHAPFVYNCLSDHSHC